MGCASSSSVAQKVSIHERYLFTDKLGSGSFGQVRVCVNRETKEDYAVKILDLEAESVTKNRELRMEARDEAMLWKQVGHDEHVVSLMETYNDYNFSYFVMERCNHSLCDNLLKRNPALQEFELLDTFRQMLLGLQHCHSKKVIHRDIKPANFLVGFDGLVKLCDFGLSKLDKKMGVTGIAGTAPYMSPEMVQGRPYGTKTDVFSLGSTCYLMLYGTYPYQIDKSNKSLPQSQAMQRAIANNIPAPTYVADRGLSTPSSLAKRFVRALLKRDDSMRPSATEALQLPAMNAQHDFTKAPSRDTFAPAIQLAKQTTADFKQQVNPTVAKKLNELLEQLQQEYGKDESSWAKSFTLPSRKLSAMVAPPPCSNCPTRSHSHDGSIKRLDKSVDSDCSTAAGTGSDVSLRFRL